MIPTDKGGYLLMVNNYTFSRNHQGTNMFYCSKRLASKCRARVKVRGVNIFWSDLNHNHAPPNYMIPTDKGGYLLMVNNYTFSRNHQGTNMFYCSKRLASKCRARVKVRGVNIFWSDLNHNHAPPNYEIINSSRREEVLI
ncbi:Modifier of mdg4 [Operophtera brumata]|uniref:Modifier of mdg4 n=1 Tax=Operophtera brumata TaxID=104452 RepID=A0A0L7LNC2_OPEBR|nr:Modifier of mdg4 [Operophtera brumata]